MFNRVVDWFTSNTPDHQPEASHEGDLALATAALMMEVARADQAFEASEAEAMLQQLCLLYTSPSPRDATLSRMPSSA